jgi:hypothetical protein
MEKITKENYEIAFIDYIDGNLSPEMQEQLNLFLLENPELKLELDEYNKSVLAPNEADIFDRKNQLKKIELVDIDEQIAAYAEGDLNNSQKQILESISKEQPQIAKDMLLMASLKLTPFQSDTFEEKEVLKKFSASWAIDESNIQLFLAADLEGDLTELKKKELDKFIAENKKFSKEKIFFSKTKFSIESDVVFPNKSTLYKSDKKGIVINLKMAFSIAAMFVIVFGLFKFYSVQNNSTNVAGIQKNILKNSSDSVLKESIVDNSLPVADSIGKIIPNQNKPSVIYKKQFQKPAPENKNTAQNFSYSKKEKEKVEEIEVLKNQTNGAVLKTDSLPLEKKYDEEFYQEPIGVNPLLIEQYDVAENNESKNKTVEKIYSLREFISEKFQEKLTSKKETNKGKEIKVENNIANSISKATGIDIDYKKEIKPEEEFLSLSIGSFEYSRKKSGK